MRYINSMPKEEGYFMPAEFAPHEGTLMIWPVRPGSWPHGGKAAKRVFTEIITHLSKQEKVWVIVDREHFAEAKAALPDEVQLIEADTDDAWARDTGPTFVIDGKNRRGINWTFNAWGGDFDGLYASWENDDKVAKLFMEHIASEGYDASPFVLEGGSIHADGEGTVLVTESCLLSQGRNPQMTKAQIAEKLIMYLGAEKVIWLPCGIYNDETNEHVDNVCCFSKPGEVILAWTDDEKDPQYEMSHRDYEVLENTYDARGRKFVIHKMYIPEVPVTVTKDDLSGYVFEEGEDFREEGERLAASYVNFYIANGIVLVPQFGDVNDKKAVELLQKCFPDRKIVPIFARDIIVGGGNIHCITQQIPTI